jgi:hypothetical protein
LDPLVRGTDPLDPDPHQNVTDPQLALRKVLLTYLFASLKLLKKGVGSGAGSVSRRYGSVGSGSDQNVTDSQHLLCERSS